MILKHDLFYETYFKLKPIFLLIQVIYILIQSIHLYLINFLINELTILN